MKLLHLLWATDFDALQAKLASIGRFAGYLVISSSMLASALHRFEEGAKKHLKSAHVYVVKIVDFCALNWHNLRCDNQEKTK